MASILFLFQNCGDAEDGFRPDFSTGPQQQGEPAEEAVFADPEDSLLSQLPGLQRVTGSVRCNSTAEGQRCVRQEVGLTDGAGGNLSKNCQVQEDQSAICTYVGGILAGAASDLSKDCSASGAEAASCTYSGSALLGNTLTKECRLVESRKVDCTFTGDALVNGIAGTVDSSCFVNRERVIRCVSTGQLPDGTPGTIKGQCFTTPESSARCLLENRFY